MLEIVNVVQHQLAVLLAPVPEPLLVVRQHLLVLLQPVLHLDLHRPALVEQRLLRIELTYQRRKIFGLLVQQVLSAGLLFFG